MNGLVGCLGIIINFRNSFQYVEILFEEKKEPVFEGNEYDYDYCNRILQLHAIADCVCTAFGMPVPPFGKKALYTF